MVLKGITNEIDYLLIILYYYIVNNFIFDDFFINWIGINDNLSHKKIWGQISKKTNPLAHQCHFVFFGHIDKNITLIKHQYFSGKLLSYIANPTNAKKYNTLIKIGTKRSMIRNMKYAIKKKLRYSYNEISLEDVLKMWPDFEDKLHSEYIAHRFINDF